VWCGRFSEAGTRQTGRRPVERAGAKAVDAIWQSIAQARIAGDYDLVVVDGPALPCEAADCKLLNLANGIVAVCRRASTSTRRWMASV